MAASAFIALLIAVRLARAAHGDVETALAIMQHAGTANVLIGIGVTSLPLIAPLMIVAMTAVESIGRSSIAAVALTLSALLLPIGAVPLVVLAIVIMISSLRADRTRRQPTLVARVALLILATVLASLIVLEPDVVWLASERIELDRSGQTVVGYVLADKDDRTVVLRDTDRRVLVYDEPWSARNVCMRKTPQLIPLGGEGSWLDLWAHRPLISLLLSWYQDGPDYPSC